MDRSRFRPRTIAVAVLCLAVIAFAAATLDSTTDPDGAVGLGNPSDADELGASETPDPTPTARDDDEDERPSILDLDLEPGSPIVLCVEWLTRPLAQAALVVGLAGLFAAATRFRDAAYAFAIVFVIAYPGLFVYLLLTSCHEGPAGMLFDLGPPEGPTEEGGGLVGGGSEAPTPDLPTALLLLLVAATLVGVAAVLLTGDHDAAATDEADGEADDDESDRGREAAPDVAALGEAAGRAADRIEHEGGFENEVYRAWAEMTEHLAVERPESSTPAEFASAAVDAGMDPADVERLTSLFEDVRYGDAAPTPDRESEAVATLRRIESTYADENG